MSKYMTVKEKMPEFIEALTKKLTEGCTLPTIIRYYEGRKYIKVTQSLLGNNESVYCFINNTTGSIYKPATWYSPELNKIRGNIFGEDMLKGCGLNGMDYLR